ncbi:DNA protecting protein DprA [gamma proteobacterium HTCC5015]|nr:DNA protecting protein DprA [gamma proteobacterium HTCC5015]
MDELSAWLRLWLAPNLGAATSARLVSTAGSAPAVLRMRPNQLRECGLSDEAIAFLQAEQSPASVAQARDWVEAESARHLIYRGHPDYPPQLEDIARPPAVLAVLGDVSLLRDPQLAMVGSRSASRQGAESARAFAKHLAAQGLVMTSGLALGIDGACHEGALASTGSTVAVMATGADRVYPAKHRDLAHRIVAEGGALVTEFPLGSTPQKSHFPQRNRVIAGLSTGVLVVEATLRSGSLITARFAQEQGREVFAMPGSIHQPTAKGCHALIKQGAKLVESAEDILEELAPQLRARLAEGVETSVSASEALSADPPLDSDHEALLQAMGFDPVTLDALVQQTDFDASELASMLLILELEGRVSAEPGGRYQRLK